MARVFFTAVFCLAFLFAGAAGAEIDHDGVAKKAPGVDETSGDPHQNVVRPPGVAKTPDGTQIKKGDTGLRFRPGDLGTAVVVPPDPKDPEDKEFLKRWGPFQGGKAGCDEKKGSLCCTVTVFYDKKEDSPELKWGAPVDIHRVNVKSFVSDPAKENTLHLSFKGVGKGGHIMCTRYRDGATGFTYADVRGAFGNRLAINGGADDGAAPAIPAGPPGPVNPLAKATADQQKLNDDLFNAKNVKEWIPANTRLRELQAIASKQERLYTDGLRILDQYKGKIDALSATEIQLGLQVLARTGNLGPAFARGRGTTVEEQMVAGQAAFENRLRAIEDALNRRR